MKTAAILLALATPAAAGHITYAAIPSGPFQHCFGDRSPPSDVTNDARCYPTTVSIDLMGPVDYDADAFTVLVTAPASGNGYVEYPTIVQEWSVDSHAPIAGGTRFELSGQKHHSAHYHADLAFEAGGLPHEVASESWRVIVPEPGTMALLLLAAAGLSYYSRREDA